MGNSVLLDTDIFVDVSRGNERAVDFLQGFVGERVFTTVFTYAELLTGASNQEEAERIGQFLSAFIEHRLPLYSRNRKHFRDIPDLEFHLPY